MVGDSAASSPDRLARLDGANEIPEEERRGRIEMVGNQLVAAGGPICRRVDNEEGFWLVMQDPEGNELCVN